ncbi:hypothetical protein J1N35_019168 [Gossypium stocksii]|uniref:Uncharacterized protein n=1 Tax=Gossypium stocksii TaxID=47602 RepID=A0A9D3VQF3_9ROSI|nr:hypothetical protein J1N35_019168 [Gossypium stocksii]
MPKSGTDPTYNRCDVDLAIFQANKLDCSDYASTRSEQSKHDIVEQIMKAMQDGEKVTGSTLRLVFRMITL